MLKLIKFGAKWCSPCKILDPRLEKLKQEFSDVVEFQSIDVDEDIKTTADFNIKAVPTVILLKDEQEVFKVVGAVNLEQLRKNLTKVINNE